MLVDVLIAKFVKIMYAYLIHVILCCVNVVILEQVNVLTGVVLVINVLSVLTVHV